MSLEPPRLNLGVRHNGKPRGVHRIRWESVRVLLPKVAYSFALRGSSRRVCIVWSFCLAISGLEGHWGSSCRVHIAWSFCLATSVPKENWGSSCRLCSVLFLLCREAQRYPERPREALRGPERPREAQRGPERPEKPREPQRSTETHRYGQRGSERRTETHKSL